MDRQAVVDELVLGLRATPLTVELVHQLDLSVREHVGNRRIDQLPHLRGGLLEGQDPGGPGRPRGTGRDLVLPASGHERCDCRKPQPRATPQNRIQPS